MEYHLPLGAVVIYRAVHNQARLIVVQHSKDCDGSPLYMVAERPIEPPSDNFKMLDIEYLTYRLFAGWFAGNVGITMLEDTGERVGTTPFFEHESSRHLAAHSIALA